MRVRVRAAIRPLPQHTPQKFKGRIIMMHVPVVSVELITEREVDQVARTGRSELGVAARQQERGGYRDSGRAMEVS